MFEDRSGVSPCAVATTTLATFDGTGQFFSSTYLNDDIFPSRIKDPLDSLWNIDNLTGGDHFVEAMNISIEHLVVPEIILCPSVFIQVHNGTSMRDLAFSSKRREWASIRMHRCEDKPSIGRLPVDISRSIVPIDADGVHWQTSIVVRMQKLHYTCQIVRLSRRLANQVDVIWAIVSNLNTSDLVHKQYLWRAIEHTVNP